MGPYLKRYAQQDKMIQGHLRRKCPTSIGRWWTLSVDPPCLVILPLYLLSEAISRLQRILLIDKLPTRRRESFRYVA